MMFLYKHWKPGSFRPVYCDTDSMAIALSNSTFTESEDPEEFYRGLFDSLVKEEMKDSWEANWKKWFVTTKQPEIEKKPGLMKCKLKLYAA